MEYKYLKERLLNMFDSEKLHLFPEEWGFFNEAERDIKRIGYATNLTGEIIERAKEKEVDFLLTHHDSWEFINIINCQFKRLKVTKGGSEHEESKNNCYKNNPGQRTGP